MSDTTTVVEEEKKDYAVNYDDSRFKTVESDKNAALAAQEKLYGDIIGNTDKVYQQQIDASKEWEQKQTQLQQEQTDFAIQKIEQQKDQANKDYTKEQSGAYVDWQKQSNEFGAEAEKRAAQGLENTGFSESSQVAMYTAYQNRVAVARENHSKIILDFNNAMTQARLQNNASLAEIAFKAHKERLELNLQQLQAKNALLLEQANKKTELEQMFHERWQDVLAQVNTEHALAEEARQFNEQMAEQKRQFDYKNKLGEFAKKSSGGSSGGGSSKKSSSSSASINKDSSSSSSAKIESGSSSGGASVNLKSVIDSGLGPASGTTIANAVKSGQVTATQKDNQIYISPNKTGITSGLLYSSKRF